MVYGLRFTVYGLRFTVYVRPKALTILRGAHLPQLDLWMGNRGEFYDFDIRF
jgi:hypothetical protein